MGWRPFIRSYPQSYPHNSQFIPGLSVIIITRNEERDIEACLETVKNLAEEIILVDSGSTDRTIDRARPFTEKIFHRDWTGYSAQKQFALDKATGPWVLNIDADERVTPTLQNEIREVLQKKTTFEAFDIPFHHYFWGQRLRFGGVGGETHVRLFRKDKAQYGTEEVHEGIQIKGSIGSFQNPIAHESYSSIQDYLEKCNAYTSMIAVKKFASGERFHMWHYLRLPFEFFKRALLQLGVLDGNAGLTYAILSSYYVWLKFAKLRDLERKK